MKILVTGSCGYIGSHICKILIKNGYYVIGIDNLSSGNLHNNLCTKFYEADICKVGDLDYVFRTNDIDIVIHVAGKAFVNESFENIPLYYNVNCIGTINILNSMVKYNINKIIFSSSFSIYGVSESYPITENSIYNPISPYGHTKKISEEIIIQYSKIHKWKYSILRYFNVAGNDFDFKVNDLISNYGRIIPTMILKCKTNEVLKINGNDYKTKDGTCMRSFIHVLDLADAHVKSIDYLQKDKSIICNVASDNNYTILELIKVVEECINNKIKYEFSEKIQGDPDVVYCDYSLIKKELGWFPKYNIYDIVNSHIGSIDRNDH